MQWGEFKSIQDCTQYKIYCLAWLIYHAFTICLGIFSAHSPLCCVSVSLSVSLSLRCCNFSVTVLPVIRWRGHGACHISKSALWPKNKWGWGGFKSTDKCRGGSLFNLRVQTLPQDIASVFFSFSFFFSSLSLSQKYEQDRRSLALVQKQSVGKKGGHEEEMKVSSGYDKWCNWLNPSYGTGLVLLTSALHHYFFYPPTKKRLTRGLLYTDDSEQVPPSRIFSSE